MFYTVAPPTSEQFEFSVFKKNEMFKNQNIAKIDVYSTGKLPKNRKNAPKIEMFDIDEICAKTCFLIPYRFFI